MENLPPPGADVLVCQTMVLDHWGQPGVSFRAPYWRLYRNRGAGLAVRYRGKAVPLVDGMVYLIPPETDFEPVWRAVVRHFFLHFTLLPPFDRPRPGVYALSATPDVAAQIDTLEAWTEGTETPALVTACSVCALALVYAALHHLPAETFELPSADDRIARARAAIQTHLRNPLSNDRLADLAHMTANAFIRRFHEVVGESPQQYSRRLRVERACILLHTSASSIDQIAEATGFCDRFHFSRVFQKVRGISPAAFRKLSLPRPESTANA